jgi:hypothetical protein
MFQLPISLKDCHGNLPSTNPIRNGRSSFPYPKGLALMKAFQNIKSSVSYEGH